jgi:hypothetical protein
MSRWINRYAARRFPQCAAWHRGERLLYVAGEMILAAAAHGMLPPHPFNAAGFGGLADRFAVEGERARRAAVDGGAMPERVFDTGRASTDRLFEHQRDAQNLRQRLCERFGLRNDRPTVLLAVPQLAEHGLCTWTRHWEHIEWLLARLADSTLGANVVLSLHPKSDPHDYRDRAARHGARIAEETRIEQLVPACDLFVATHSSTVVMAIGCATPAVVLNLYGMDYDTYGDCPGVVTIDRPDQLSPALREILTCRSRYDALVAGQQQVAADWIRMDGQCTSRLVAAVDDLAGDSPQAQPRRTRAA